MLSASKRTSVALTEKLIPNPLDQTPVCLDNYLQFSKHPGFFSIFLNVNMHCLTRRPFIGVEEKSQSSISKDFWHCLTNLNFEPNNTKCKTQPSALHLALEMRAHIRASHKPKSRCAQLPSKGTQSSRAALSACLSCPMSATKHHKSAQNRAKNAL
jgi:hypothetical protein